MRLISSLLVCALIGCGSASTQEPMRGSAAAAPAVTAPAQPIAPAQPTAPASGSAGTLAHRCLPLVVSEICTMPCSSATRAADGTWHLDFWSHPAVQIQQVCRDGGCTEAFTVEMPIGGECIPRSLDTTCHFDGSACVGATREANWPPPP
jgi:hypothetical protein